MTAKLQGCDCLNHCGDDDRVAKGEVLPCATWLRSEEQARCERAMFQLVRSILASRAAPAHHMIADAAKQAGVSPGQLRTHWMRFIEHR